MNVFQTDNDGYLVGSVAADPDPLTPGNWLIPRGCVGTQPPALAANESARWENGAWVKVPDQRGRVYWLADGSRHEITERGIAPPAGALDSEPPAPPPSLPDTVANAHAAIDAEAGAARARYITVAPGQEATYILKEAQSRAYKAAGYPAAAVADYPMVDAEARAINGATPDPAQIQAAADGIIAQADAWIVLASQIERARIAGKRAVSAAVDVAAVEVALASAVAELEAL